MTSTAKIGIASATGIGAIGAGSAYAFYPSSTAPKVTIEKQLEKDNKKLLKSSDNALWGIKLNTYTTKIKKTGAKINLSTDNETQLRTFCTNQAIKEFNNQNKELYDEIKVVCTVPTNKEKFEKANRKLATTGDWATKSKEYQTQGINNDAIAEISKDSVTEDQIKNWCEKAINLEYENDDHKNYKLTYKWCTKD
ncbi:hypothetical protein A6V39_03710 [Candidatus Mycoplasma haematobovis]|uniref:Uncharacterized protein n=1 Tax=Candidatus Mycoplasma haematobovis TaxID=432608 RepID=A0A1A9QC07_9MOLU|nr:hypothetical protein [Candidatus Mycoplasma haematobovis]OAL09993.1 hypothetical protein A6V39_03710 [Candidatus Mycoplasma haematobovis]